MPCTSDLFGNISVPVFGVWLKSKSQVEPKSVNVDVLSFTAVFGYSMMFLLWMRRCWAEMVRAQSSRLSCSADGSFASAAHALDKCDIALFTGQSHDACGSQ